ncbi:MAG: hypothetical protein ACSLFF_02315 [Solirubrobacterales bacterium]
MARSIAESVFPFAQVRGESVPVNQVLFPTVIAPLVGSLSMSAAYPFIAAVNAIVFATAAIPAYLLTNLITANRSAARCVAIFTVVTPSSKALPDQLAYVVRNQFLLLIGPRTSYSWVVALETGQHADFKLVRGSGNVHVEKIEVTARPGWPETRRSRSRARRASSPSGPPSVARLTEG